MSRHWSDNSSTVTDCSAVSEYDEHAIELEVDSMFSMIQKDMKEFKKQSDESKTRLKRPTKAKHRAFVAVCSPHSVSRLSKKCQSLQKPAFHFFRRKRSSVVVTTDFALDSTIRDLAKSHECDELVLVVSGHIEAIDFDVPSNFRVLMVLRCGFGSNAKKYLHLDGSSTFCGSMIQRWAQKERRRRLFLGPAVLIDIDPEEKSWANSEQAFKQTLSSREKIRIRRHVEKMKKTSVDDGEWWKRWRGSLASILGILACGAKLAVSIKASAGGALFQFQYGLLNIKAGAACAEASAFMTAAGPAVLIGVGVAAAVYYVPWDSILEWLGGILSWLSDGFIAIWEMFKDWMASGNQSHNNYQRRRERKGNARVPRPMDFSF
ncbi:hypothetical protein CGCS363_v003205 [Colletotrichum siamense]|uniref:uncharacterized protein n=1 Tax=Colletotrichum siamense TaxID=690259 RepID=UPI00187256DC|nr:uncharacterized protein CGCS363_v003205 [Colletotrichum siamense]KAF5511579.1 hypothetical protein CGCS363_v003205 [Colletotrichum siamense]